MKDCKELYVELNKKLNAVIEDSLIEENVRTHAVSHNFVKDFEKLIDQLSGENEVVLYKSALIEYQYALLFVSQGLYRQAFNSLRFCLEHTFFGVYLSTSELNFRMWRIGQLDVYWSEIVDEDKGIFSKMFINLFNSDFTEKSTELRELSKLIYRECSEFTHGNYKTALLIPESIKYDEKLFGYWQDKAETVRYLITIIFFIRYSEKIQSKSDAIELENSIVEYIGTIPQVQAFYGILNKEG